MQLPVILLAVAVLLVIVSLIEPMAARLKIASSVLLAVVGIVIGAASAAILASELTETSSLVARFIVDFPVDSQTFIYGFLPILLFQASMSIEVREMIDDWAPIFVLAVVAVVFASLAIGFALYPFAPVPLAACLLLGAIVATTDPIAVIGIFRDIGAPARLSRLVDGESLLNDAAAITLFTLFADLVVSPRAIVLTDLFGEFLVTLVAGTLIGIAVARAVVLLLPPLRATRAGQISVCVALPYLAFLIAELGFHVSGVVAVVAAGITLNLVGPSRMSPAAWSEMRQIWGQLDYWAASLLFILASILMPKLLQGLGLNDLLLIVVLVVSATAARFVVLFGLLPLMARLGLSPPVETGYRWVILWGGLRGASTIALALSITENAAVPADVQRFVAVLATGFVLFTLLVQGTTMKSLMHRLGMHRLSPVDSALRYQVLARVDREAGEAAAQAARLYRLDPPELATGPLPEPPPEIIAGEEKLALGLVAVARRERELVLERFGERTVAAILVGRLLADAGRLIEGARLGGEAGYRRADARALAFSARVRFALWLNRVFRWPGPLARALSDRFEVLLIRGTVIEGLGPYVRGKLAAVYDGDIAQRIAAILDERLADNRRALEALRLQYPVYAAGLDRRFLKRVALRHQERHYLTLLDEGLIGPAVCRELQRDVDGRRAEAEARPQLDLELDAETLIARLPFFVDLGPDECAALARLLKPRFSLPGDCLIRKDTRGDAAFFIASGAVEVAAPAGNVRLGRGDVFGELALLTEGRRTADIHALGYCSLLVLDRRDFRAFLDANPDVAARIDRLAGERIRENREALAGPTPQPA